MNAKTYVDFSLHPAISSLALSPAFAAVILSGSGNISKLF
jgi:hypothetical protein